MSVRQQSGGKTSSGLLNRFSAVSGTITSLTVSLLMNFKWNQQVLIIIQYPNPSQAFFRPNALFIATSTMTTPPRLQWTASAESHAMLKPKKGREDYAAFGVGLALQRDSWVWPHKPHLQVPTTDHGDTVNVINEIPGTVQLMRHRFLF